VADDDQQEPDRSDLLSEHRIKSVADINREMQYLSWPYRVQETAEAGVWTLTDVRNSEILHRTPPVDEAVAVHIMRAWMRGYDHGGSFDIVGQYLLGMLPDDDSPY
jgi:hypothetical protein